MEKGREQEGYLIPLDLFSLLLLWEEDKFKANLQ